MQDLSQVTEFVEVVILPLIGALALFLAKVRRGDAARLAERHFLAVLVVITIMTLRTVINCDEIWLVHTVTLGTLIIAAQMVPSQDAAVAVEIS